MSTRTSSRRCQISAGLVRHAVPLSRLVLDPANARRHEASSIEAIKGSLARFGQQKPVVCDAAGVVIAGNGVVEAARALGWTHVAAVRTTLRDAERTAFAIADNRIAELSTWDRAALAPLLDQIGELTDLCGWTPAELEAMKRGIDGTNAADADEPAPDPPAEAVTRPGDNIILGEHRLRCGDSASRDDLAIVLRGDRVDLVNTDPPYNVKVEPRSNNAIAAGLSSFGAMKKGDRDQRSADLHRYPEKSRATHKKLRAKDRPLANDFVSDREFDRLLDAWFGNAARVMRTGASFYIWGGYANCANYPPVLRRHGLYFSQAVIWIKEHPVLTRKDFMGNHEWCFYGWREGGPHRFFGPNNVPDTWSVKKVNPQSMVHLTEKPVELAARAIEYSSKPGEVVLDLFGGSGSTLMACERLGRRARLMEIDPLYCDVIVERWEKATGRRAERTGGAGRAARTRDKQARRGR